MTKLTVMKARVARKGIRATDIKVKDLLTNEQIASISETNVFDWVATKIWSYKDFKRWLDIAAPYEDD
jgi:aminopeptidase-like protein